MKDNKIRNFLRCLFIFIMISMCYMQSVFAWTPDWDFADDISAEDSTNTVYTVMGAVINVVSIAGAGIAIISLIWLAIRYINTYHPAEKAEIKKQLPVYVTGAVILFGASALLRIIQYFVDGNINNV